MRESARITMLADELKKVAGWGCGRPGAPQRLARMPVLSELAEVQSLPPHQAGCIIMRYLKDAILAFKEDREYLGRRYDAPTLRRALLLELGFELGHLSAPARQYRTMQVLKQPYTYDQWRKHHLLQRGLLTLLAERMVSDQTSTV